MPADYDSKFIFGRIDAEVVAVVDDVRLKFVSTCTSVRDAPGTAAPEASVAVPRMVDSVWVCAPAGPGISRIMAIPKSAGQRTEKTNWRFCLAKIGTFSSL